MGSHAVILKNYIFLRNIKLRQSNISHFGATKPILTNIFSFSFSQMPTQKVNSSQLSLRNKFLIEMNLNFSHHLFSFPFYSYSGPQGRWSLPSQCWAKATVSPVGGLLRTFFQQIKNIVSLSKIVILVKIHFFSFNINIRNIFH